MTTTVLLVRHGQAKSNVTGFYLGWPDEDFTLWHSALTIVPERNLGYNSLVCIQGLNKKESKWSK